MAQSLPMQASSKLYYIFDPMCSWCYGFAPVWKQVLIQLQKKNLKQDTLKVQTVLGGLAADTNQPMPDKMQMNIRANWLRIQQEIPGITFNYDFWTRCQPRRSTYPACRAVIACGLLKHELKSIMIAAIQQAYYLDAKNPSDDEVLIGVAEDIGLDREQFSKVFNSKRCVKEFENDLILARKLGVSSFPSLVLQNNDSTVNIPVDYNNSKNIVRAIERKMRT